MPSQPHSKVQGKASKLTHAHPILREMTNKRVIAGIRQADLADKVGVSTQTLTLWERGRSQPTLFLLAAAIEALGGKLKVEWNQV